MADEVTARIDLLADAEEGLAVARLLAADEEHDVMLTGELLEAGYAIGHLAADGVAIGEVGWVLHALAHGLGQVAEGVDRHGGLAEQTDGACEVDLIQILLTLDDDGGAFGLTYQAIDLGMTFLAEDDDLDARLLVVDLLDAFLQLQHYGTGGIDDLDVVLLGQLIGRRRLAMSTEQDFGTMNAGHLRVVDGLEALLFEAVDLLAVVHDVAQTVEVVGL